MVYTTLTNAVLKFIYKAHEGAVDRAGLPYVYHPLTVAATMDDEDSTVVALLHDVLEDTSYTLEDIKGLGVSEKAIEALQLLTHDKDEPYMDYIQRIKSNPLAAKVKLADLKHNSDLSRLTEITPKDKERVKKYKEAQKILKVALPKKEKAPKVVRLETDEEFVAFCKNVYEEAKKKGTISISFIQRRFCVGYLRAGKTLEWLEKNRFICRSEGSLIWTIL